MAKERRRNDTLILDEIKIFKEEFIKHKTTVEILLLGTSGQKGICEQVADNNKSIQDIKYWQAKIIGASILLSAIIGAIFNLLK